ncbi:MAG: hypothetical protein HON94_02860 [Methylococcales bacterium]|jgi:hypothetical protein|nr:hypothetical protein [Methylococcales bacterium]
MNLKKQLTTSLLVASVITVSACKDGSKNEVSKVKEMPKQEIQTIAPAKNTMETYTSLVKKVTAAVNKAKSVGGEWRDVQWRKSKYASWKDENGKKHKGSLMKVAEIAAKAGDYNTAIKLLKSAMSQAELGYKQAMEQKNLKAPSYL